jgi:BTB/POZ domain-containing protein 1/2
MCIPVMCEIYFYRFIVDRRIFVVGFGLYGSIHGPTEYDVNLQVIHTSSGKVCGSNNTSFSCDGSNYTFRVMFKEPVEIHPNTSYTASATLKVRVFVHLSNHHLTQGKVYAQA